MFGFLIKNIILYTKYICFYPKAFHRFKSQFLDFVTIGYFIVERIFNSGHKYQHFDVQWVIIYSIVFSILRICFNQMVWIQDFGHFGHKGKERVPILSRICIFRYISHKSNRYQISLADWWFIINPMLFSKRDNCQPT